MTDNQNQNDPFFDFGTPKSDFLVGDSTTLNVLVGLKGDDFIYDFNIMINQDPYYSGIPAERLYGSDAFLFGNEGNDTIGSYGGNDVLKGGRGDDEMFVSYNPEEENFTGDTVTKVAGGRGEDTLTLRGFGKDATTLFDAETGKTEVHEGHKTVIIAANVEHWSFE